MNVRNREVFEDDVRVQVARCHRYGEQAAVLRITRALVRQ